MEKENNLLMTISQYYGNIYVRLWDKTLKKNVAKIETQDLMAYLQNKIDKKRYTIKKEGVGNTLAVLKIK